MKNIRLFVFLALLLFSCKNKLHLKHTEASLKGYKAHSIAFYNLENLYGIEEDPNTVLPENTLKAEKFYTQEVYQAKLKNIAKVIADLGKDFTGASPTIIGVAEVENFRVLNDLLNQESLLKTNYAIVHYDSPDLRGIDVGLLYKKKVFTPTNSRAHKLLIYHDLAKTKRKYTRNILVVSGILEGEKIHLIVNHWPSRSGGQAISAINRTKAAQLNKHILDSLFDIDPKAKIINMGDFNDEPTDPSIKKILSAKTAKDNLKDREIYNPMEALFKKGIGSLAWGDQWSLFDQIMLSAEFIHRESQTLSFYKAEVYNKAYLTTPSGRYKDYPYRSYSYQGWTGGYSDHFPVLVYLIKKK